MTTSISKLISIRCQGVSKGTPSVSTSGRAASASKGGGKGGAAGLVVGPVVLISQSLLRRAEQPVVRGVLVTAHARGDSASGLNLLTVGTDDGVDPAPVGPRCGGIELRHNE